MSSSISPRWTHGTRRTLPGENSSAESRKETDEHPETILYNYLATPRRSVPRWHTEGSAVFMETWLSGGIGRAQGGYDEMVFRAMVRDDAHFYSALGVVSAGTAADFQTMTTAYLYGTRFFSYLGLVYSPEQVVEWLSRGEQSDRYYGNQFERVFGKPLTTAWSEWIAWEHQFQKTNLESVRKFPLTTGRRISPRTFGSISKSYVDPSNGTMIGGFLYPGVVSHIGTVSLADGSVRRLVDIKGPMKYQVTSTAFDPQSRTFFYTADNVAFRDLMALDLKDGSSRMLMKDARIGDLAFNPADRSLLGVRHENGYATLVRIKPPYKEWNQIVTLPYGQVLTDLDISPDGKRLSATMEEIDSKQYLRVYSIEALLGGALEPVAQFDFGTAVPEGFVFSPDGRFLFGSSYYTGVSNLFRFEIATSEIKAITNAETGYFRPIPQPDGTLLALEYSGTGFVPDHPQGRAAGRPERHHLPGRRDRQQASGGEDMERGLAGGRSARFPDHGPEQVRSLAPDEARRRLSDRAGLSRQRGGRLPVRLRRSPAPVQPRHHRQRIQWTTACHPTSACMCGSISRP